MHGAAVATIVGGRLVYLHPDYTRINELKRALPLIGRQNQVLNTSEIAPAHLSLIICHREALKTLLIG